MVAQFEKLFKEQYTAVYSYAFQILGDEEECRDLVSESFAQLWKRHEEIEMEKWRAFLYRTIHNKCVDRIRKNAAYENYAVYYQIISGNAVDDKDEVNLREEKLQQIHEVIKELPERTQYILKACYFSRRKYADVADELNISSSTVKKHIVKALAHLRDRLQTSKQQNTPTTKTA